MAIAAVFVGLQPATASANDAGRRLHGRSGTTGPAHRRSSGRTDPTAVSDVRPQVNGIIKARLFVEGSTVKVGQALYQIDPAPYQAAYDSAAATLSSAKVKASRYAELLKANAIAPQDNDDAQAAYKLALANTETAKINLDYTRIIAPITGAHRVPSLVTVGALVTANQTNALDTISTLDPIYVDIDQSATELLALERSAQQGQIDAAARSPPR